MLVLVCGPTGIGKTTLMQRLAAEGCGVVTTWTTRPPRAADPFKVSLDASAYRAAAGRFFWPAQRLYGHFYGEDYAQLMAAACPRVGRPWLLDMALDTLALFDAIPRRLIVLMPAEPGFLAATLDAAGRADRLPRALAEEAEWRAALAEAGLDGTGPAEADSAGAGLSGDHGVADDRAGEGRAEARGAGNDRAGEGRTGEGRKDDPAGGPRTGDDCTDGHRPEGGLGGRRLTDGDRTGSPVARRLAGATVLPCRLGAEAAIAARAAAIIERWRTA